MRPCKIKLDDYDFRVIINGLAQYREIVPVEDLEIMDLMLPRLIETSKSLKPGMRTKCLFSPVEKRLVRFYLNEWRNQLIRVNNLGGMDGVTEVMLKFT